MQSNSLSGKQILVGITGGIAAYKSAELVRHLVKAGAQVRVVMTDGAREFITPLTMQALSGNPVSYSLLDEAAEMGMGHIELARWADLLVVAPASADFIARLHAGLANDLLTTVCLATAAPIALAPAMNEKMWHHPMTQRNLAALPKLLPATLVWGPAAGEQACGDVGEGRMLEAQALAELVTNFFKPAEQPLAGRRVVITAGPTQEPIDPVRYLTNRSSGKMGFALAAEAAELGAEVTLIAGPVSLPTPPGVQRIDVCQAVDMLSAAEQSLEQPIDLFIGTAAVADFRPAEPAAEKLKKGQGLDLDRIDLVENPDIIATVSKHPKRPTKVVAFAAETQNLIEYGRKKLTKKGVDWVVANDVSKAGVGFGSDNNEVILLSKQQEVAFGPADKKAVAKYIFSHLVKQD